MIIKLKNSVSKSDADKLGVELKAFVLKQNDTHILITPSALKEVDAKYVSLVDSNIPFADDIQLASKKFIKGTREIDLGNNIKLGGSTNNTIVITGPCSVESREQIEQAAQLCVKLGVKILRAGAFKPRTSPYTFQGMGVEGLKLLDEMRKKHGLLIITEIRDSTHLNEIIEYADIIQVGAKAMYDHGILKGCAKANKPVLLKRGFGSTVQEFVQAAEFILSGGNDRVMLCERGIRTFETKTRFTLGFVDELARVETNDKHGCIDRTGKIIIPIIYDEISLFKEGLAMVKKDTTYGYIDMRGEEIILFVCEKANDFSDGLAIVEKEGNKFHINKDGLARVETGGKYGYIDITGKEGIPIIYDEISRFKEGLAMVKKNAKYGYVDKRGKEIIPIIYDSVGSFYGGLAQVEKDGEQFYINKEGKKIDPPDNNEY